MNTIVINALNSNSGGGKSIRDSYLKLLNDVDLSDQYVILVAKGAELDFITNPNIEIMELPGLYSHTFMAPIIYRFVLGRLIGRIGAGVVLNLGDLIVHTSAKQIYVFDWPYALDVHRKVWASMKPIDWLNRKVKLFLLNRAFHRPDIVIAQTDVIKDILERKYDLKDVRIGANAITIDNKSQGKNFDFMLPQGPRLLYPAIYYPHKNLEILLDVAELIEAGGRDYQIIITVDPHNAAAQKFLDAIRVRMLESVIINVGQVPLVYMQNLYGQCNALLMPTLLETFGLPYLEAMAYGLPVFTSDMWFAHAVCGEAAKYFDPLDAKDMLRAIDEVLADPQATRALVEAGARRLTTLPSWEENFATYRKFITELL